MCLRLICYQVKSIDSETRLLMLKLNQTLSSMTLNKAISLSAPLSFITGIVKTIVTVTQGCIRTIT